eukprot:6461898-Amphidinium_carterae.1
MTGVRELNPKTQGLCSGRDFTCRTSRFLAASTLNCLKHHKAFVNIKYLLMQRNTGLREATKSQHPGEKSVKNSVPP